jgi:broad specificity phosphatase PhoE
MHETDGNIIKLTQQIVVSGALRELGEMLTAVAPTTASESAPELAGRENVLPTIYLARHGETAWTVTGQHTGITDLPLTPRGESNARALGERLKGIRFARVLTSPFKRAARTCELAGFAGQAEVDLDLVEWNYGDYEGLRSPDIHAIHPNWDPFRDGFPGGESFDEIGSRADRVIGRIRSLSGPTILFSSGHFLRFLAARWLGLNPQSARYFILSTSSLSTLTYEHNQAHPVIGLWNDTCHVELNPQGKDHESDAIPTQPGPEHVA